MALAGSPRISSIVIIDALGIEFPGNRSPTSSA
jgi:hypothetical protein